MVEPPVSTALVFRHACHAAVEQYSQPTGKRVRYVERERGKKLVPNSVGRIFRCRQPPFQFPGQPRAELLRNRIGSAVRRFEQVMQQGGLVNVVAGPWPFG
jgi:hypothetical protein